LDPGLPFKEIIDLSVPMKSQGTAVFPGYPMPFKATMTTLKDTGWLSYLWVFVEHSGTHVDAPIHVLEGGTPVDKVPLGTYVARGAVLDMTSKKPHSSITDDDINSGLKMADLQGKLGPGWALLLQTGWTAKAGTPQWLEYPDLSIPACNAIVKLGVNAVGLDSPSPDYAPLPSHKVLLAKGIGIFENLTNLDRVKGKDFIFVGAPLPLVDGSGIPVRAFALVR
jgi:kynurenine formamidase